VKGPFFDRVFLQPSFATHSTRYVSWCAAGVCHINEGESPLLTAVLSLNASILILIFASGTMQGVPYELLVDKTTYHIQLNIGDIFVKALLH
jgi:hypothetical protein